MRRLVYVSIARPYGWAACYGVVLLWGNGHESQSNVFMYNMYIWSELTGLFPGGYRERFELL